MHKSLSYKNLFKRFNKAKIKYLVVGGVAVNLHGYPRFTADLDLMIDLEKKNVLKVIDLLEQSGFQAKIPGDPRGFADKKIRSLWFNKRNMKVFSFVDPKDPLYFIDIFIYNPIKFNSAWKRRRLIKLDKIEVNVVSLKDLIKLKYISARPQDIADIENLKKYESYKARKKS